MDEIESHYETRWGSPSARSIYEVEACMIEIYKWDIEATDEGVVLYSTNGASEVSHQGHRVEFFTGMYPGPDEIAASLAILAAFPLRSGPVSKGETITLAEPLWFGTPMRTYLVVPPRNKGFFPLLELSDGSHVDFLQVIPIHEVELESKRRYGAEWLLGEINDQGMRASDPFRKPIQYDLRL